jgi:hypothetical protein
MCSVGINTNLIVPVGDGQGLIKLVWTLSLFGISICSGGMGFGRLGGLGSAKGGATNSPSPIAWNTIFMLVLGNRSTHL